MQASKDKNPGNQKKKKLTLEEQVQQEIENHLQWCHPKCDTFLPTCYRKWRIERKQSAEEVQKNYDWCHIFR